MIVNLSVFCSSRGFYTYMHMYICIYIHICLYKIISILTFFSSRRNTVSVSQGCSLYRHLWKIVQNKASQYLCSQDIQKWKRMVEICLPIELRLDEEFSQVEKRLNKPLDYFCTWRTSWILKGIEITGVSC